MTKLKSMTDQPGMLVTIEGIDGSGKTLIADCIDKEIKAAARTQEPSEQWTGKQVRRAIDNDTDVHPVTTFHLFMADRKHHIEKIIKPTIEDGGLVVSDRYADSTRAYQPQALAPHISNPDSYIRATMAPWALEPDLTFYLKCPVDVAMERLDGDEEYEKRQFLEKVKRNYEERIIPENSERFIVLDATADKIKVKDAVLQKLLTRWHD